MNIFNTNLSLEDMQLVEFFLRSRSINNTANAFGISFDRAKYILKKAEGVFGFKIYSFENNYVEISAKADKLLNALQEMSVESMSRYGNEQISVTASVFLAQVIVEKCLPRCEDIKIALTTYSIGNVNQLGLVLRQYFSDYEVLHLSSLHEHLIDPDLYICKYSYKTPVYLYASKNYIEKSEDPLKTPQDLLMHSCIVSKPHAETWSIVNNTTLEVEMLDMDSTLVIDSKQSQVVAIESDMGIIACEKLVIDYNNNPDLVRVLPDYHLKPTRWGIYVKKDSVSDVTRKYIECFTKVMQELFAGEIIDVK